MKKLRFYRSCIIALSLVVLSACSYLITYDLISKKGLYDIELSNVNGLWYDSKTGNVSYDLNLSVLDSNLEFFSTIDTSSGLAILTVNDERFTSKITFHNALYVSRTRQARINFYGFPKSFDPLKKYPHFIEVHLKNRDSTDYYYKFKNKE